MNESTTSPLPPIANRGVERLECRPDWAEVSFPSEGVDDLAMAYHLLGAFASGPSTTGRGGGYYGHALRSDDHAAAVHYEGRGDAAGTVLLTLTGEWWAAQWDVARSVRDLLVRDGHVARFDLAADYSVPDGAVRAIADAVRGREWVTRLRSAVCSEDLVTGKRTVYLGSKASDRRTRIYDKRGPVRIELQCRNDIAGELLEQTALHGPVAAHRAALGSVVDFPTVGWWSAALRAS